MNLWSEKASQWRNSLFWCHWLTKRGARRVEIKKALWLLLMSTGHTLEITWVGSIIWRIVPLASIDIRRSIPTVAALLDSSPNKKMYFRRKSIQTFCSLGLPSPHGPDSLHCGCQCWCLQWKQNQCFQAFILGQEWAALRELTQSPVPGCDYWGSPLVDWDSYSGTTLTAEVTAEALSLKGQALGSQGLLCGLVVIVLKVTICILST